MAINVSITENDKFIKCLLLANFELEQEFLETKKFLCFKSQVLSKKFVKSALIFIPWQHREKEIRIVEIDKIIEKNNIADKDFIRVNDFVSPYVEESPYYCEFRIKNFYGYDFIYNYANFIANIFEQDGYKSYEVLYKNKPELLSLSNGF
ncbi:MAG: hypothetical protein K2L12_00575 [Clostridia bacterium]|nr:hypothetical protein [Clostridia bacterium]